MVTLLHPLTPTALDCVAGAPAGAPAGALWAAESVASGGRAAKARVHALAYALSSAPAVDTPPPCALTAAADAKVRVASSRTCARRARGSLPRVPRPSPSLHLPRSPSSQTTHAQRAPAAPDKLVALPGRLLIVGFGSIAAGVLPLILRHVDVPVSRVTLLTAPDRGAEAHAAAARHGLGCLVCALTPDNYRQARERLLVCFPS